MKPCTPRSVPVGRELRFEEPRSGRPRSVALDARTVEALRAHRARTIEERLAIGLGRPVDSDLVFANHDGSPVALAASRSSSRCGLCGLGSRRSDSTTSGIPTRLWR